MSEPKSVPLSAANTKKSFTISPQEHEALRAHFASLGIAEETHDGEGFILPWNGGPPKSKEAAVSPKDQ